MSAQCRGEILAEAPPVGRAVVIDDADLVVPETIDAVLVEKELRVQDEKVAHFWFSEVEHQPAGVPPVGEVERVVVAARSRLPVRR